MGDGKSRQKHSFLRSLGVGLITGAADDDCSAIGTYAQAGAQLGYKALWTAPVTFPMMIAVVYLSGKLAQVTGKGLFSVLRSHYARWLVCLVLVGVTIGNTIEAGADLGAMAAAIGILVHVPHWAILLVIAAAVLVLQLWGSYRHIRNLFRVLAMSLLAYIVSGFLSHPKLGEVVRGTLAPSLHLGKQTISILVAIIGTTLSAYLYTWQSNEVVENKEAAGKHTPDQLRGVTEAQLDKSAWDIGASMLFSNVVMYFIILATAATLFTAGKHSITTAAEAAQALTPLAGRAAGLLFTVGIIGVGFLAVPVMTAGAAYNICQVVGWKNGLQYKFAQAKGFYAVITIATLVALTLNFVGVNPMRALVLSGIVQGFSTPPLMLLIVLLTSKRSIMGDRVNGVWVKILGWSTTAVIFCASTALVVSWFVH